MGVGFRLALVTLTAPALLGASGDRPPAPSEGEAGADEPVLHERLPAPASEADDGSAFVYDARSGGSLPSEIRREGQRLQRPPLDPSAGPAESLYRPRGVSRPGEAAPGDEGDSAGRPRRGREPPARGRGRDEGSGPQAGRRRGMQGRFDPRGAYGSRVQPDRRTEREGTLRYQVVFDPSIAPFKRHRALARVASDGTLQLRRGSLERLEPVGNRRDPDREVFWGSILLRAEAGERLPLPSVSPRSRILSYEARPATELAFYRDASGNFYVEPEEGGRIRLVYLMDAPSTYFGRSLPEDATRDDVPAELRPDPPASMQRSAARVARKIGIDEPRGYAELLRRLVGYFRAFEAGAPPEDTGDAYLDLALNQRGICRHRTYAFVVTARALGVPARYVFNEAHVFAEIWLPGESAGWLRVDLGGAADRLEVRGGRDTVHRRTSGPDPFAGADGRAGNHPADAGATEIDGMPPIPPEASDRDVDPRQGDAGGGTSERLLPPPTDTPRARPDVQPTRTTLELDDRAVVRGEPLQLQGRVEDARGGPVDAGRVRVVLLDRSRRPIALLGGTHVQPDGRFELRTRIPRGREPGRYEVVAQYLGTAAWAPSTSP